MRLLHILEPEKLTEGDTRKNFLVPLKVAEKEYTRKNFLVPPKVAEKGIYEEKIFLFHLKSPKIFPHIQQMKGLEGNRKKSCLIRRNRDVKYV